MLEIKPEVYAIQNGAAGAPALHWVCLDIETCNPDKKALDEHIKNFRKDFTGVGNTKNPETIKRQCDEKIKLIREKAALLDIAPITVIGVKTSDGARVMFHTATHDVALEGWSMFRAESENQMMLVFAAWLENVCTEDTLFVGHNIKAFDIPKLRLACVRNNIKIPAPLSPISNPGIFDTMRHFPKFSTEHSNDFYVSFATVSKTFGIEGMKETITGAEVPKLWAKGEYEKVITYCALDVVAETKVFEMMT